MYQASPTLPTLPNLFLAEGKILIIWSITVKKFRIFLNLGFSIPFQGRPWNVTRSRPRGLRQGGWWRLPRNQTRHCLGSRDGTVVRALAFHQCGPGSIPGPGVICGLSLLVVLDSAPRGFSPGTAVFPSPQKPAFPNSNSIWNARTFLKELLWTPWCCSVGKQITFTFVWC